MTQDSAHFHIMEMSGRLVFESKHKNFRVALSDYLSQQDHGGIQLKIKDMREDNSYPEDVVVEMTLIRMKQHPQDHRFPKGQKKPVVARASDQVRHVNGVDTCFY